MCVVTHLCSCSYICVRGSCVVLWQGWVGFTLLSELPTYLTEVLGFTLQSAGLLCVFPYLALLCSTLFFSRVFEYLGNNGWEVTSRQ